MLGQNSSGKRTGPKHAGSLANHHGAWPHASAKTQENHHHGGRRKLQRAIELHHRSHRCAATNSSCHHRHDDGRAARVHCKSGGNLYRKMRGICRRIRHGSCSGQTIRRVGHGAKHQVCDGRLGGRLRRNLQVVDAPCLANRMRSRVSLSSRIWSSCSRLSASRRIRRRKAIPGETSDCRMTCPTTRKLRLEFVEKSRAIENLPDTRRKSSFALRGKGGRSVEMGKRHPGPARGEDIGRLESGCRDRIRTGDLRGMNPVSYLCSTLLRNGWSVMVRRRRSNLTRRGTDGRYRTSICKISV